VTVVLLVRHAVTDATGKRLYGRAAGVHLSEEGLAQAKRVAARLAEVPVAALYSSPLERCVETAEPIAEACRLAVRVLPDVTEVDYGELTGRTFAALARTRLWRRLHAAPSTVRFPGGESLAAAQERVVETLRSLAERHSRSLVALVSHGDPIRLALAHYGGVHIDLYQRIEAAPSSISAVALDGVPRILRLNDTGTLGDLVPTRPAGRRAPPRRRRG